MKRGFFGGKKQRKTNIIVPQLSKICHCYSAVLDPLGILKYLKNMKRFLTSKNFFLKLYPNPPSKSVHI
jgi:hypothetical protein